MSGSTAAASTAKALTFRPSPRWTVPAIALSISAMMAVIVAGDWPGTWRHGTGVGIAILATLLILVPSLMGWLLHHVFTESAFTLDAEGLVASDDMFRSRRLAWADIRSASRMKATGIEFVDVVDAQDRHVLLCASGIDRAAVHARLAATAGPNHVLTLAFAS